uniref:Uncharacterized protein n=1 Tax=Candidatus Kentrum sp. DK TaxID=2126562 RepID=A0A450THQ2_9GAMM|nr:MAG: hypothetical protein BECKDK2373C_GA0170839_11537 [Candidatus Kentron sp. DK]
MGGIGSGRRWHYDAKDTTGDYRSIDVRRLQRDGLLAPGRAFNWQWFRDDEVVGSIRVLTEADRVILDYRHQRGDSDWKEKNYPVLPGLDSLQLWRKTRLVPLPRPQLRAGRGNPLQR